MSALATDPHAAALVAAFRTDDGRAPGTPPEGTRRCDDGTTWRYEGRRWVEEGTGTYIAAAHPQAVLALPRPSSPSQAVLALVAEVREARAEAGRLRAAIRDSGYAVMEASNGWSIHDVSDRAEAEARETLKVVSENIDLAQENGRLRAALEPFARAAANLGRVGDGVGCYAIGFWHAPEGCPTAADLANRVLDRPYADQDGEVAALAQQTLRALERAAHLDALLDLLVWQDSTPTRKWWHRWSAGAAFASRAAAAADLLSLAAARRATAAGTAAAPVTESAGKERP